MIKPILTVLPSVPTLNGISGLACFTGSLDHRGLHAPQGSAYSVKNLQNLLPISLSSWCSFIVDTKLIVRQSNTLTSVIIVPSFHPKSANKMSSQRSSVYTAGGPPDPIDYLRAAMIAPDEECVGPPPLIPTMEIFFPEAQTSSAHKDNGDPKKGSE
jgi:hypothetical protein